MAPMKREMPAEPCVEIPLRLWNSLVSSVYECQRALLALQGAVSAVELVVGSGGRTGNDLRQRLRQTALKATATTSTPATMTTTEPATASDKDGRNSKNALEDSDCESDDDQ